MKKITFLLSIFLSTISTHQSFSQNSNNIINAPGDIAFVAYHDNLDGFSFVLMDDAPDGTVISFIDEELDQAALEFPGTGESELIWQVSGATIVKGTVIDVYDNTIDHIWRASMGTLTENNNLQFGNTNYHNFNTSDFDQVYAVLGRLNATQTPRSNPTAFLAFIDEYAPLPGALIEGQTALTINGEGYYSETTVFNGTLSDATAAINTLSNWTFDFSGVTFYSGIANTFTGTAFSGAGINIAPVIGGTSAGQIVDDNATISLFSTITTTDADEADNLTATITLDDNAKGVITGADSGSGPYTMTSKTPAAMQTALRALVFNPTDNRAAVSETTTFTVS